MKFKHPVTPADMNEALASLCNELSPNFRPVYVDVRPAESAATDDCLELVEEQVSNAGGKVILGWSLWEIPGLFVEAEFLAVWQLPSGEMVDIAPKTRQTQRILFLQDPSARYKRPRAHLVRRAINQDQEVLAYFQAYDDMVNFMDQGQRILPNGEIQLDDDERAEYSRMQQRLATLHTRLSPRFPSFGPYTACWCGSGKKMKWCHRSFP